MKRILVLTLTLWFACTNDPLQKPEKEEPMSLDGLAERYVKLVLAVGRHDADYVDAYYGPDEWKPLKTVTPEELEDEATDLLREIDGAQSSDEMEQLRISSLKVQLTAVKARLEMLQGKKFSFDEEARLLYDVKPPTHDEAHFQAIIADLESQLPGEGSLTERLATWRKDFIIPPEKLDSVFQTAITEARKRTAAHMALPEGESFVVEYVTDKPWSGYNWYKGNVSSLIQVNTDLPVYIDRAIDLACHEGFPGHHVYNALLEKNLVRDRGWVEFSVYPLFSPQSLVAEGSANYGIRIAFPKEEREAFEKDVLFPLAGLDPQRVEEYYRIMDLVARSAYAGNEAARNYLDGKITREQAADWLVRYALMAPERAAQRVDFIERYRSYVINYNLGQDLVDKYVKSRTDGDDGKRWSVFETLISRPALPSAL